MAVTVKTKIKRTGADARKVADAFHEVMHNTPAVVKSTERKFGAARANKQKIAIALHKAGVSSPDKSGANYVSPNVLYVPPGASSGVRHAGEHVPYKPVPGATAGSTPTPELIGNERSQVNGPEGFGPSYTEGIDTVKAVDRTQNPVEAARQKNNRTRDMRTNLGRGKQSQPTVS